MRIYDAVILFVFKDKIYYLVFYELLRTYVQ